MLNLACVTTKRSSAVAPHDPFSVGLVASSVQNAKGERARTLSHLRFWWCPRHDSNVRHQV